MRERYRRVQDVGEPFYTSSGPFERGNQPKRSTMLRRNRRVVELPDEHDLRMH